MRPLSMSRVSRASRKSLNGGERDRARLKPGRPSRSKSLSRRGQSRSLSRRGGGASRKSRSRSRKSPRPANPPPRPRGPPGPNGLLLESIKAFGPRGGSLPNGVVFGSSRPVDACDWRRSKRAGDLSLGAKPEDEGGPRDDINTSRQWSSGSKCKSHRKCLGRIFWRRTSLSQLSISIIDQSNRRPGV